MKQWPDSIALMLKLLTSLVFHLAIPLSFLRERFLSMTDLLYFWSYSYTYVLILVSNHLSLWTIPINPKLFCLSVKDKTQSQNNMSAPIKPYLGIGILPVSKLAVTRSCGAVIIGPINFDRFYTLQLRAPRSQALTFIFTTVAGFFFWEKSLTLYAFFLQFTI